MKSDHMSDVPAGGRPDFHPLDDPSGAVPDARTQSHDAAPRSTTQAERGVMHPGRDDVEWRYWRGGWGRLAE